MCNNYDCSRIASKIRKLICISMFPVKQKCDIIWFYLFLYVLFLFYLFVFKSNLEICWLKYCKTDISVLIICRDHVFIFAIFCNQHHYNCGVKKKKKRCRLLLWRCITGLTLHNRWRMIWLNNCIIFPSNYFFSFYVQNQRLFKDFK